jgi:hypothetical protein
VAGGPSVDRGALTGVVLGDVGGDAEVPAVHNEASGVVGLVGGDGTAAGPRGSRASISMAVARSA